MTTQLTATVRDYVGRTVDYLAFDNARVTGDALLNQALIQPGQTGALITGIEKLVQRFLLELLTEQGSMEYQPNRGTFFMTALRYGMVQTSGELFAEFSTAELDVREKLRLEEDFVNDPADERYAEAVLLSASLSGDTATLSIRVSSVAGESRTVIYPLRIAAV